uniref:Uncharacterized protein n=1 Tax=Nelumbo nucifera TaxID=4432 RepID=A0A822XWI2_NELNU|nr:TPA_asm: hypothetical protein HUJ06_024974 [Nelumbo nucifera]
MHVIVQVIESSTVMAHQTIPCLLLTHIALLLLLAHQTTARVPAVIVFGDSSVDSGNNNQIPTILKSNFRPYGRDFEGGRPTGRFSNGRIPSDFISEALGAKPTVPAYLDPMYNITDFATGVCFASAGTGYDNATSAVLVSVLCICACYLLLGKPRIILFLCFHLIFCVIPGAAVCNTSVEGIGILQGLPKKTEELSWGAEGE